MKIGDRIRLLEMPNDPAPLPAGAKGTITYGPVRVGDGDQYGVMWYAPHGHRSLSIIVPPDRVEIMPSKSWVVMARSYRHKSSDFVLKESSAFEEAQVRCYVDHPEHGRCFVGSFVCGPGMFNIHFPLSEVRPATEQEKARILGRKYGGGGIGPFGFTPEEFADQATLDALPLVSPESL